MKIVVVVLCLALAAMASAQQQMDRTQGNVTILGDITVAGALRTGAIRSQSLTIDGAISVANGVSAESLTVNHASLTVLTSPKIASPTGVVTIIGNVAASGDISSNGTISASSFIQNDVRQWAVTHHDDFEQNADGWSTKDVSSCDGVDHHLAGHCNNVKGGEVRKTFTGLPEHQFLRLQARYHFLDSWEGETAFAKIGDKVVWTDVNDIRGLHPDTKSVCGGDHPDSRMSVPIDVTIRHTGNAVDVSFGSTLDEHPCNESFGIDDVIVSVR